MIKSRRRRRRRREIFSCEDEVCRFQQERSEDLGTTSVLLTSCTEEGNAAINIIIQWYLYLFGTFE